MDPDVADAIPDLVRGGVLAEAQATPLHRVASGERVSVHEELRIVLYGGVLLVAIGVGLLVSENLQRLGPSVVAISIGAAAAVCLLWVGRHAPAFSRGETRSPHLAFDYLLLLGALLAAADLAYVEVNFTPLGPRWTWHLLIVAVAYAGLGARYDSRTLFSLALSTFAAWRGVSLTTFAHRVGRSVDERVAAEAVAWGVVFVLIGLALARSGFKAHFEPVATHLGWLLAFLGPAYRLGSAHGLLWGLVLLGSGAGVAAAAYRARRFWLFAMGVVAAHAGLSRCVHGLTSYLKGDSFAIVFFFWLTLSGLTVVGGLGVVHRRVWGER